MSKSQRKRKSIQKKDRSWELFPLQFILAVLPLILYLYQGTSGYGIYPWNQPWDDYVDVFLHGKMIVFLGVSVVVLVLTVRKVWQLAAEERKKLLLRFLPLAIYFFMVILSTICSEYKQYSLFGAMDQKEPFFVLAGYVIVLLYAYLVLDTTEDVLRLVTAAMLGSACMSVLGVLQAVGRDPLATATVQRLFAGNEYVDMYGPLQLSFPVGQAYGTLFNPNYAGTYVALYVPILLAGVFGLKVIWKKVVCGISVVGLLILLFASQSRTGLLAVLVMAVLATGLAGRILWKRWYLIVPPVVLAGVVFLGIDISRDGLLTNRLKEMFFVEKSRTALHGIDTTGDGIRVSYQDTQFTIQILGDGENSSYRVSEDNIEKEVVFEPESDGWSFRLSGGEKIVFQRILYEEEYGIGLKFENRNYFFIKEKESRDYKFVNVYTGRPAECKIPKNAFPGYEALASGRGFVWGRTLPLLLDQLVIGSGPDTFAVTFPQNDYVGRYKIGMENNIYTRPHSFYLQMGVQTGVVSLVAFMVFYGGYFVSGCKRYFFCEFKKTEEQLGAALWLSTVGFMIAGLANDSLIVVSPVFYVLLGTGLAVNDKLCPVKKQTKK